MNQKTFDIIAAVIFTVVALTHLVRIAQGMDIVIAGNPVPMWGSWLGLIIAAVLAISGFRLASRRPLP